MAIVIIAKTNYGSSPKRIFDLWPWATNSYKRVLPSQCI